MDRDFWERRWRDRQLGFHQASYEPRLTALWPGLGVAPGAAVLVPLCGKSLDMVWLAEAGHPVVGVELSELAVTEFFVERGLSAVPSPGASGVAFEAGPYRLWLADLFELAPAELGRYRGFYDRAAFVAMAPGQRAAYVARLAAAIEPGGRGLLIALDKGGDPLDASAGPPFSAPREVISAHFGPWFEVEHLIRQHEPPSEARPEPTALDAYRLIRRAGLLT